MGQCQHGRDRDMARGDWLSSSRRHYRSLWLRWHFWPMASSGTRDAEVTITHNQNSWSAVLVVALVINTNSARPMGSGTESGVAQGSGEMETAPPVLWFPGLVAVGLVYEIQYILGQS